MAEEQQRRKSKSSKPLWRATVDKATGRTYYYNSKTRETTWTKPLELSDPAEQAERKAAEDAKKEFFRAMEGNMRAKMKAGMPPVAAFVPPTPGLIGGGGAAADWVEMDSPLVSTRATQVKGRTISTVDDLVLEQAKRTDSYCPENVSPIMSKGRKEPAEGGGKPKTGVAAWADLDPLNRRNSSSTIFVDTTMSAPDKDATIECVCTVIRAHMLEAQADLTEEHPKAVVFHDHEATTRGKGRVPSLAELVTFFRDLYTKSQMEMECIIMCLVYMERLTKETHGQVQVRSHNWKSLLLSTMILSSKVWDDLSMWNADFSQVCPSFNLKRINELELGLLDFLQYSVKVSASDYAK